ncbi:MAG: TonB-dependent receptor [Reichenbachiella sp.]
MKKLLLSILLLGWLGANAQHSITGSTSEESNESLPGATLVLHNTNFSTVSDIDGKYEFKNIPSGTYTIEVSYVGYQSKTQKFKLEGNITLNFELEEARILIEDVTIHGTRANEVTPTTYTVLSKEKINERNLGQDLPLMMNFMPSVVTSTDAGAGIGYTNIRVRGSDATRINVTANGIPLNDPESHGVYWVNMPDLTSSVNDIQMQRGVGTSTNGAGAFGASINMKTNNVSTEPFAQVDNSIGSFNTWKSTVMYNTGLLNNNFNFEGRLSRIVSDGYIDRSASNLKSYYMAGGYYGKKTTIKAIVFGGNEKTQQAWYGTPEAKLNNDSEGLQAVIDFGGEYETQEQIDNLLNSDRRFNYYLYDNEVDNYSQDHFQLHFNHTFSKQLTASAALHYTYGRGYFEQYRNDDDFADYNLDDVVIGDSTITSTNLIRRRWLDNDFYGATWNINYATSKLDLTLGGAYNIYDGDHYGEIIWAQHASNGDIREQYYKGNGLKKDFNLFLKANIQLTEGLNLYADLQVRNVDYTTSGTDNDLVDYDVDENYTFINPKFGINYILNEKNSLYASYAMGNREPVRSDFIDATGGTIPEHETLNNIEVGYKRTTNKLATQINYYFMGYNNQLVATGSLNDVGSAIRTNVDESYRMGIEASAAYRIFENLVWNVNLALSQNKIASFTEVVYDYAFDWGTPEYTVETLHEDTDIAFSPSVIVGSDLSYSVNGFTAQVLSKYVGKQYLDNTTNDDRAIEAFFINDVRLSYDFAALGMKNIGINLLVNNIFNVEYESNGYTWGYLWDGYLYQQNNYYPQAGTNFLLGLSLKF